MADRYWVGGSGTWDSSSTTNWSTTSGGAGGASAPTSADNVFFDGNSGSGTITVSANVSCNDIRTSSISGLQIDNSSSSYQISIHGDINFSHTDSTIDPSTSFIKDNSVDFRIRNLVNSTSRTSSFFAPNAYLPNIIVDEGPDLGTNSNLTISVNSDLKFRTGCVIDIFVGTDFIGSNTVEWDNDTYDLTFDSGWIRFDDASDAGSQAIWSSDAATYTFTNLGSNRRAFEITSNTPDNIDLGTVHIILNGIFTITSGPHYVDWTGTLGRLDILPSNSSSTLEIDMSSGITGSSVNTLTAYSPNNAALYLEMAIDRRPVNTSATFVGYSYIRRVIVTGSGGTLSPSGAINATNTTFREINLSKSLSTNTEVENAGASNVSGRTPATFTSTQSGDWTNPATWGESSIYPYGQDDVVISSGHTVTVDPSPTPDDNGQKPNYSVNDLTVNGVLICDGDALLDVLGDANINNDSPRGILRFYNVDGVSASPKVLDSSLSTIVLDTILHKPSSYQNTGSTRVLDVNKDLSLSGAISGTSGTLWGIEGAIQLNNSSNNFIRRVFLQGSTTLSGPSLITISSLFNSRSGTYNGNVKVLPNDESGDGEDTYFATISVDSIGSLILDTEVSAPGNTYKINDGGTFSSIEFSENAPSSNTEVLFESGETFNIDSIDLSLPLTESPFTLKATTTSSSLPILNYTGSGEPLIQNADISYIRGEPDLTWYVYDSNDLGNNEQLYFRTTGGNGLFWSNF